MITVPRQAPLAAPAAQRGAGWAPACWCSRPPAWCTTPMPQAGSRGQPTPDARRRCPPTRILPAAMTPGRQRRRSGCADQPVQAPRANWMRAKPRFKSRPTCWPPPKRASTPRSPSSRRCRPRSPPCWSSATPPRRRRSPSLVKTYSAMKPKDAARIFDSLPDDVLVPVAQEMKSDVLAPVLAKMNPEQRQEADREAGQQADLARRPPARPRPAPAPRRPLPASRLRPAARQRRAATAAGRQTGSAGSPKPAGHEPAQSALNPGLTPAPPILKWPKGPCTVERLRGSTAWRIARMLGLARWRFAPASRAWRPTGQRRVPERLWPPELQFRTAAKSAPPPPAACWPSAFDRKTTLDPASDRRRHAAASSPAATPMPTARPCASP